jgi:predicted phage tail protein
MRPEAPVERLAALEANLTGLRRELEEEAKERRDEARKLAQAGDSERQAHEASIKKLQDQLERFGAEGLNIEMVGVYWVILGAIFMTVPGELASVTTWTLSWLGVLLRQVYA